MAFSQAKFAQQQRNIFEHGNNLAVPMRTEGGSGGGPVWTNTVQSQVRQERELAANGANAVRLAPTQFVSDYAGGLLDDNFHQLNPAFGGLKVDFHA